MRRIVVLGVAALFAAVSAQAAGAVVPAKTVRSADGLFVIKIPRGALRVDKRITIVARSKSSLPAKLRPEAMGGKFYEVKPHGLRFRKPVTVVWRIKQKGGFDASEGIPKVILASRIRKAKFELLGNQSTKLVGKILVAKATTRHFSSVVAARSGHQMSLTPDSVAKREKESWTATVTFDGAFSDPQEWTRSDAVRFDGEQTLIANTRSAKFTCGAVGTGKFGYVAEFNYVFEIDDPDPDAGAIFLFAFGQVFEDGRRFFLGTLAVSGDANCVKTGQEPNHLPTASFTFTPNNPPSGPKAGQQMEFLSSASDPDGAIVSWRFDWGDGSSMSGSGHPPSLIGALHTYSAPGIYKVRLTVTDNGGASFTTPEQEVKVSGPGSETETFSFPCPNGGGVSNHPVEILIPSYAQNPRHTINNPICPGANPQTVTAERISGNASGDLDPWGEPKDTYRLRISVNGTTTAPGSATPTVSWD